MKRLAALGAWLALGACVVGAGYGPGGVLNRPVPTIPGAGYSRHGFTHDEYTTPQRYAVRSAIAPCFDDGYSSFATFLVPVLDSIRAGQGRFAESLWAGVDLRATVFLEPSATGVDGSRMTRAQVQALGGRQLYYELGTHGNDTQRLGFVGMNNSGTQVSYAGVTGMSREFLRATLGAYQDSAASWGIPAFRSNGAGNWRQQYTMADIWREFGFYQNRTYAVGVSFSQSSVTALEYNVQQRNTDEFVPAIFGKAAQRWMGFHRMGELLYPYDVGARASWDTTSSSDLNASTDSLKVYTDMLCQIPGTVGIVTFHDIKAPNTRTGELDIEHDELYDLIYYWASRQYEGLLDVLTFEQAVARIRGIRDGNLMPHKNFMRLADSRVTSSISSSVRVPVSMIPSLGATDFYTNASDTLVSPGGTAGFWKILDLGVTDTVTAAITAHASADSVTWGTASKTGNVIIQEGATANTDALDLTIITSGARGRYLMLAVQALPTTPATWAADFYLSYRAGQYREVWEDNVNHGRTAYQALADWLGSRNLPPGPDTTGVLPFQFTRQRVRPQFLAYLADTSSQGLQSSAWGSAATLYTNNKGLSKWLIAPTLTPVSFHDKGIANSDIAIRSSHGSISTLFTAPGGTDPNAAADDHDDNWETWRGGRISHSICYIPINAETDYVQAFLSVERNTTTLGSNMSLAILNIEAWVVD